MERAVLFADWKTNRTSIDEVRKGLGSAKLGLPARPKGRSSTLQTFAIFLIVLPTRASEVREKFLRAWLFDQKGSPVYFPPCFPPSQLEYTLPFCLPYISTLTNPVLVTSFFLLDYIKVKAKRDSSEKNVLIIIPSTRCIEGFDSAVNKIH